MPKIYVVILIGIPNSGKTTFCKQMITHTSKFNVVNICFDDFITMKKENLVTYRIERSQLIERIDNLLISIKNKSKVTEFFKNHVEFKNVEADYLILIDDNNYYRSMRYVFVKICKNIGVAYMQIYFPIKIAEALERNKNRNEGKLPETVISNMYEKIEVPSTKFFWETATYIIKNNANFENVLSYIETNSVKPFSKSETTISVDQIRIHTIDVALRKHIKNLILNYKTKDSCNLNYKMLAEALNFERKIILKDIRSGILNFDNINEKELLDILSNKMQRMVKPINSTMKEI